MTKILLFALMATLFSAGCHTHQHQHSDGTTHDHSHKKEHHEKK